MNLDRLELPEIRPHQRRRRRHINILFNVVIVLIVVLLLTMLIFLSFKGSKGVNSALSSVLSSFKAELRSVHFNLGLATPIHLNVPIVIQQTEYTCGAASAAAVLQSYGISETEESMAIEMSTNNVTGTPYQEVVAAFQRRGFRTTLSFTATVNDLRGVIARGGLAIIEYQAWKDVYIVYMNGTVVPYNDTRPYPSVWDCGHYSVIVGMDDTTVYLMDPYQRPGGAYGFIPIWNFEERWHDLGGYNHPGDLAQHLTIFVERGKGTAALALRSPTTTYAAPENVRYTD